MPYHFWHRGNMSMRQTHSRRSKAAFMPIYFRVAKASLFLFFRSVGLNLIQYGCNTCFILPSLISSLLFQARGRSRRTRGVCPQTGAEDGRRGGQAAQPPAHAPLPREGSVCLNQNINGSAVRGIKFLQLMKRSQYLIFYGRCTSELFLETLN